MKIRKNKLVSSLIIGLGVMAVGGATAPLFEKIVTTSNDKIGSDFINNNYNVQWQTPAEIPAVTAAYQISLSIDSKLPENSMDNIECNWSYDSKYKDALTITPTLKTLGESTYTENFTATYKYASFPASGIKTTCKISKDGEVIGSKTINIMMKSAPINFNAKIIPQGEYGSYETFREYSFNSELTSTDNEFYTQEFNNVGKKAYQWKVVDNNTRSVITSNNDAVYGEGWNFPTFNFVPKKPGNYSVELDANYITVSNEDAKGNANTAVNNVVNNNDIFVLDNSKTQLKEVYRTGEAGDDRNIEGKLYFKLNSEFPTSEELLNSLKVNATLEDSQNTNIKTTFNKEDKTLEISFSSSDIQKNKTLQLDVTSDGANVSTMDIEGINVIQRETSLVDGANVSFDLTKTSDQTINSLTPWNVLVNKDLSGPIESLVSPSHESLNKFNDYLSSSNLSIEQYLINPSNDVSFNEVDWSSQELSQVDKTNNEVQTTLKIKKLDKFGEWDNTSYIDVPVKFVMQNNNQYITSITDKINEEMGEYNSIVVNRTFNLSKVGAKAKASDPTLDPNNYVFVDVTNNKVIDKTVTSSEDIAATPIKYAVYSKDSGNRYNIGEENNETTYTPTAYQVWKVGDVVWNNNIKYQVVDKVTYENYKSDSGSPEEKSTSILGLEVVGNKIPSKGQNVAIPDNINTATLKQSEQEPNVNVELRKQITLPVVSIAQNAFNNSCVINSLTIGKNVLKIAANAFSDSVFNTKDLDLSTTNVEYIGENAFATKKPQTTFNGSIKLPKSTLYIGMDAFANNSFVSSFYLDGKSKINEHNFNNDILKSCIGVTIVSLPLRLLGGQDNVSVGNLLNKLGLEFGINQHSSIDGDTCLIEKVS